MNPSHTRWLVPSLALVGGMLGGLLSTAVLGGGPLAEAKGKAKGKAKVVRASAVEIVDDAGKMVARLGVAPNGTGNLTLATPGGQPLAVLGEVVGGGGVMLFTPEGVPGAGLSVRRDGSAELSMEREGWGRVRLRLMEDGPSAQMRGKDGKDLWAVPAGK